MAEILWKRRAAYILNLNVVILIVILESRIYFAFFIICLIYLFIIWTSQGGKVWQIYFSFTKYVYVLT